MLSNAVWNAVPYTGKSSGIENLVIPVTGSIVISRALMKLSLNSLSIA